MKVAVRGMALAVIVALGGCRTTHELGPAGDPATVTYLRDVTSRRATYATITPATAGHAKLRVVAIGPEGAKLDLAPSAPPTIVPGVQLAYLSTYDRLRGARDGAFILGLPAFVIGAAAGAWLAMNTHGCGCEGSEDPSPLQWGLAFGALSGLAGAIVGGGAGALLTHEDRYVLAPRP